MQGAQRGSRKSVHLSAADDLVAAEKERWRHEIHTCPQTDMPCKRTTIKRASVLLTHSLGNEAWPLWVRFASDTCTLSFSLVISFIVCICCLSNGLNLKKNPKKGQYYNRINSSKQKQINKLNNKTLLFRTTPRLKRGLNPSVSRTKVSFASPPPVASVMSPNAGQWPSRCPRADILPLPPGLGMIADGETPLCGCPWHVEFPAHLVQSMTPSPLTRETETETVQSP